MAQLKLPCDEKTIRALKVGDFLELSGRMITGRDAAHHWLLHGFREEVAPFLKDSVIYHVGPVVKKHEDGHYTFVAAGPTTSAREEPFQADVIGKYGLRGVIGKGGMGPKTLKGLREHGAVYRTPWAAPPRCWRRRWSRWNRCSSSRSSASRRRSG